MPRFHTCCNYILLNILIIVFLPSSINTTSYPIHPSCNTSSISSNEIIVSIEDRSISGGGFHYKLATTISITVNNNNFSSKNINRCGIAIVENLPKETFVDMYQLEELRRFGGPLVLQLPTKDSCDVKPIDLEKPSSHPSVFNIKLSVFDEVKLFPINNDTKLILSGTKIIYLPLHMRYAPPTKGQTTNLHATYFIPIPTVLINCLNNEPLLSSHEKLINKEIALKFKNVIENNTRECDGWIYPSINNSQQQQQQRVFVPVGSMVHYHKVEIFTFVATLTGTLTLLGAFIFKIIHRKNNT